MAPFLVGLKGLDEVEEYLRTGMESAERLGKQYRLAFPEGVKGTFDDGLVNLLQEMGLYDTIVEIPDFYPVSK